MKKSLAVLLGLCCIGGSCNKPPQPLLMVAPAKDAVDTWMPVDIRIEALRSIDLATLEVTLNGIDITDLMNVDVPPTGRIAVSLDDYWDPAVVALGLNELRSFAFFNGTGKLSRRYFTTVGEPYADAVDDFQPGAGGGFGSQAQVLGGPVGAGLFTGGLDVLSLGLEGEIVLEFTDNIIFDGPGPDFTVFENAFLGVTLALLTDSPFSEPAQVEVSQDGSSWFAFDCVLEPSEGPLYAGCAGVYPVFADAGDANAPHASILTETPIEDLIGVDALLIVPPEGAGGDSFDLADVGLGWARYVRIRAADFVDGPVGSNNAGFDLDAVAAVNSVPAIDDNENGIPDAVE